MLADELDYVVGVDTHRDSHALAVVAVPFRVVLFERGRAQGFPRFSQAPAPGHRARRGPAAVTAGEGRTLLDGDQVQPDSQRSSGSPARPTPRRDRAPGACSARATFAIPAAAGDARALRPLDGRSNAHRPRKLAKRWTTSRETSLARRAAPQPEDLGEQGLRSQASSFTPGDGFREHQDRARLANEIARTIQTEPRALVREEARPEDSPRNSSTTAASSEPRRDRPALWTFVTPRPHPHEAASTGRQRRPEPRLIRTDDPLPPRPRRDRKLNRTLHRRRTRRRTHAANDAYIERLTQLRQLPPPTTRCLNLPLTSTDLLTAHARLTATTSLPNRAYSVSPSDLWRVEREAAGLSDER